MPSPSSSRSSRSLHRLGATLLTAALAVPALAATTGLAAAAPATPSGSAPSAADLARFKLADLAATASGRVSVFVQTSGPGALAVDAAAKGGRVAVGRTASAQGVARAAAVEATTASVVRQLQSTDAKARELYTSAYTVPGVAVVADAAAVRALAARPDVVAVTPLVAKTIPQPVATPRGTEGVPSPANAVEDDYTRTREAWNTTGLTGRGMAIAVVDTGLDYTHADFGGPGTTDAYYAAGRNAGAPTKGSYDPTKFLGGYDFAGLTYNAGGGNSPYQPYPQPDANPIDGPGGGHGTHVAGTAAGFGENPDGTTFRGDPRTLSSATMSAMKIGPGSAPAAGVYSLKVFGDYGGSTNLTGEALDWIGRALTQGTRIDVVSMSLGTGYAAPDDPDNLKVDALAAQGVLPVIAAGNDGDLTDVAGSPGSSRQALTVAAADSGSATLDGIDVLAPSDLTGANPYLGQYSVNYPDTFTLSGPVAAPADPGNLTGCQPFSASDAARLAGHVAWLAWDDANTGCGSKTRFDNAHAAGAVAVLLTGTRDAFEAGIAGNTEIPGFELTAAAVTALRPALEAGTLAVTLDSAQTQVATVVVPELRDTLASFSSRGQHGSYDGLVKPDVAAPGVNVVSARAGGADASTQMSGTSMATPHTAGIAALVRQAHPDWSAGEVKADIMNTATHDLTVPGSDPAKAYGVLRQGTGRVDALQAVTNQVLVADPAGGGLVTASYGVVEAGAGTAVLRKQVQLTNRGTTPQTYGLAYRARTSVPGVGFALSASSVTVPAGGTAAVTLTMTVVPSALRRVLDPTMSATTADGRARDYVSAASGVLVLTGRGTASPLRLAVFAAPKPTSARHAALGAASATGQMLTLSGRTLGQGSGTTGYRGLVAPFVLGATSPVQAPAGPSTTTLAALDLRAVGASTTAPLTKRRSQGLLSFGVQTRGPLADPGATNYAAVLIDVDRDGRPDFEIAPRKYPGSDLTVAVTFDLALGNAVDIQPYDSVPAGANGNIFDSTVSVLSVRLAALGYTDSTTLTRLSYRAVTMSPYGTGVGVDGSGLGQVDATPSATFDVFHPPAWFGQGTAAPGAVFDDSAANLTAYRPTGTTGAVPLLVLHLQNAVGAQADRITLPARP